MNKTSSNIRDKALLAVLAALGIASTAQAQDGSDWVDASQIDGVDQVRQLSDGSVELIMQDGSVARVDASEVQMVDGQVMVSVDAVTALVDGGAFAFLGNNALLYGLGGVAALGVAAAASGGYGDDDDDGVVVPTEADDLLIGTPQADIIDGLGGNDTIRGLESDDTLIGGAGDDILDGGAGADTLSGGAGNDQIIADQFDALLDGGADDAGTREASSEADIAQGDTIDLSGLGEGARIDLDVNNQGVLQAENENSNDTSPGLSEIGSISVGDDTVDAIDFENAIGTAFDDVILGNAQDNVLIGGAGDDALHPFGGTDFVDGGEGADVLLLNGFGAGQFVDVAAGIAGNANEAGDAIAEGATVNTFVNVENINGSSVAGDVIIGDDGANVLNGLGGNDTLIGGAGDDTLIGGNNVDRARADAQGDNTDVLRGGDGNDTLTGNLGNDEMFGEAGDDLMVWNNGDGSDLMNGGEGNDRTQVNFNQNTDLSEIDLQNADTATIAGDGAGGLTFNRVELNGQSVNGLFQLDISETETLEVNFGGGDDTARILDLADFTGALELDGGDGVDTLDLSAISQSATVTLVDGELLIDGVSVGTVTNFENIVGTSDADDLTGNDESNVIESGSGDDTLRGGAGDDILSGNRGDDAMFGDAGDDLLIWNNGDGTDLFDGGEGADIAQVNFQNNSDLSNTDVSNDDVATIVEDGNGGIRFDRTELNGQSVNGLFGIDIVDSEVLDTNFGGGDDTAALQGDVINTIALDLDGGADDADTRAAVSADDVSQGDTLDLSGLTAGARVDLDVNNQGVLQDPTNGGLTEEGTVTVGDDVANVTDFENVIGTDFNDVIFGNAQNNVLIGGDGDDALHPFGGEDFVDGGAGTDVLLLNGFANGQFVDVAAGIAGDANEAGDGIADGATVNQFINIENINGSSVAGDFIIGDDNVNTINGLGGDDTINAGGGDDTLRGGDGNDVLAGNRGDDAMFGEAGDDLLIWNNGDGTDLFDGGEGTDIAQVNFQNNSDLSDTNVSNDDVATIVSDGEGGVRFDRTELNGQSVNGLFGIDIVNSEVLDTNFGGGDDVAVLQGDVVGAIAIELDGGSDSADEREASSADDIAQGDTLDLSGLSAGAVVDLDVNNQGVLQAENENSNSTAPGLSDFGSVTVGDDTVAANDFENAIGTAFNDVILGNAQDNVLIGGAGDDALHPFGGTDFVDGGEGTDVLLLNGFGAGQFVDVAAGVAGNSNEAGDAIAEGATVNTFINVENINGSSVAGDVILGDDGANVLNGLGGNDTLIGGAGDDTLIGGNNVDRARADAEGDNTDILRGGDGNDTLTGNLGDDQMFGDAGDDLIVWNNGDGSDLIDGGGDNDRVQVNFNQNTDLSQTDLQNDDVVEIDSATTGEFFFNRVELNDQSVNGLFQLDVTNTETLEVNFGGGNDTARLINDVDIAIAIELDGGEGIDTLDLTNPGTGFDINLETGEFIATDASSSNDTAINFENVMGSNFDDVITGSDAANILEGNEGDDTLTGQGGADTFVATIGGDADEVTDFTVSEDLIDVTDFGLTAAEALALASDVDGDAVIDFGDGDTMTLTGVEVGTLSEANFFGTDTAAASKASSVSPQDESLPEAVDLSVMTETVIEGPVPGPAEVSAFANASAPLPTTAAAEFVVDPFDPETEAFAQVPTAFELGDSL
ncbi:MAG: calcium-binding protein [Pseudomonadota bacterium]